MFREAFSFVAVVCALTACDSNQTAAGVDLMPPVIVEEMPPETRPMEPPFSQRPDASIDRDGWSTPEYDRTCDRVEVQYEPVRPNMLIVLDRSGSMYDTERSPMVDRWTPAVEAVRSVTGSLQDRIQFGLMLFGSDDVCGPGEIRVTPHLNAAADIMSQLGGTPDERTGGGTPTAITLALAGEALSSLEDDSYVLLVTDGAPNCNNAMNGWTCRCTAPPCSANHLNCLDDARAVSAVTDLAASGVRTFVVGYGTTEWADILDAMASAGSTGRTSHFPVDDGGALESALREIGTSVVPCTFQLDREVEDLRYVKVALDGVAVPHESSVTDGTGWRLNDERTVELIGATCDQLRDGNAHALDITLECDPVLI
jgi:hypothetical protein